MSETRPGTDPVPASPPTADPPTARTTVRRKPERARYDAAVVHAILDEALICHVGFVADGQPVTDGQPYVIPTIHARHGETVYLHGSPASRMLRTLKDGVDVCVTATLVDGLVLARSAFHHSLNYRSAVILGHARLVTDATEKRAALEALVDHVAAGRSREARPPTEVELRATLVLALALEEASAKVRTGPPVDDEEDLTLPIWAGVLPLATVAGEPEDDPLLDLAAGAPRPSDVVTRWRR